MRYLLVYASVNPNIRSSGSPMKKYRRWRSLNSVDKSGKMSMLPKANQQRHTTRARRRSCTIHNLPSFWTRASSRKKTGLKSGLACRPLHRFQAPKPLPILYQARAHLLWSPPAAVQIRESALLPLKRKHRPRGPVRPESNRREVSSLTPLSGRVTTRRMLS